MKQHQTDVRSSGILRSVQWQILTNVSEQPTSSFFKSLEIQEERNYSCTLLNIPEERRYNLGRGKDFKSRRTSKRLED
jgi:hypothetical protein